MAIGMRQRKKPLMGPPQDTYGTPGIDPGLGMQAPEEKPGLGTRLLGKGWGGKVAALGSALQGDVNAIPGYHAQQQAQQAQAAQNAEVLRRQSMMQAQRAQDAQSLAEYRATLPTAQQKNFDGFQAMDPAQQAEFLKYQDAVNPLGSIGPDGRFYNRPRASQAPTRPVGKLTPIQPTTQNTQPPQLGSNGMPATLTRAQYDAVVNARGRQATEEWARRHNIRVTN